MEPVQPVNSKTSSRPNPSTKSPIPNQRRMRLYLRTSGESGGATVLVTIRLDYCTAGREAGNTKVQALTSGSGSMVDGTTSHADCTKPSDSARISSTSCGDEASA